MDQRCYGNNHHPIQQQQQLHPMHSPQYEVNLQQQQAFYDNTTNQFGLRQNCFPDFSFQPFMVNSAFDNAQNSSSGLALHHQGHVEGHHFQPIATNHDLSPRGAGGFGNKEEKFRKKKAAASAAADPVSQNSDEDDLSSEGKSNFRERLSMCK